VATAETAHFVVEADVTLWVDELHAPEAAATDTQHENTTPRIFPLNALGDGPPPRVLCFFARNIPAIAARLGGFCPVALARVQVDGESRRSP
jgi:hypothetical protein